MMIIVTRERAGVTLACRLRDQCQSATSVSSASFCLSCSCVYESYGCQTAKPTQNKCNDLLKPRWLFQGEWKWQRRWQSWNYFFFVIAALEATELGEVNHQFQANKYLDSIVCGDTVPSTIIDTLAQDVLVKGNIRMRIWWIFSIANTFNMCKEEIICFIRISVKG